jgi:hypothetical protein
MNKDKAFDELYKLAKNCAEYNHKGCGCQCRQCEYNVFLYANERDATLIKANAYADYQRDYQRHKELEQRIQANETATTLAPLFVIGFIVGLMVWACQACGM